MTNSRSHDELLFQVKNIRKIFRNGYTINYLLDESIIRESFTFITGDSGVGKSTLLHLLGLLDRPEKINKDSLFEYYPYQGTGPVNYFDLFKTRWKVFDRHSKERAKIRREDFGFLPQEGHLLNTFTIRENLELAFRFRHAVCSNTTDTAQEIQNILKNVGFKSNENIWEKHKRSPLNLSGGQRQRLALARTIICDCHPKVIFVDEPTTYMNDKLVKQTIELLIDRMKGDRCSILVVTHEYEKLKRYVEKYLGVFQLTPNSLQGLRDACMPETTIKKLKPLQNQHFSEEGQFLNAIEKSLGIPLAEKCRELILIHSRYVPEAHKFNLLPLKSKVSGRNADVMLDEEERRSVSIASR